KDAVANDKKLADAASAWDKIAAAEKTRRELFKPYLLIEGQRAFATSLFSIARTLVRAADEKPKPNSERFREFTDAGLPSLELSLFSERPIYDDFEIVTLTTSLTLLCAEFGASNELVQKILAGKSPRDRASELVTGCKLKSVDLRKKLYEGGKKEVDASDDP